MKLLKIKDNAKWRKDTFSEIGILTSKIANKTLEQLEREGVFVFPETIQNSKDITRDQMILQEINDTYHSGNVMGFLGFGNERLIIESRFCGNDEDYFFQYLLEKVLDFPNLVNLKIDMRFCGYFYSRTHYIYWYNHKRIKLSLGGMSPLAYLHKLDVI